MSTDRASRQDVASPAAAVLERRQRRTTPQKRKQVCSERARSPRRGPMASGPASVNERISPKSKMTSEGFEPPAF
jgi:hypothetical protein